MIENIENWLNQNPFYYDLIRFAGIALIALIAYLLTHKVLIKVITRIVKKTKTKYDDILLNEKILRRASYIPPLIILHRFQFFDTALESSIESFLGALIVIFIILIINAFIDGIAEVVSKFEKFKDRPLKGYAQVVKIIMVVIGIIMIVGILTGQSFWNLFAGLGAISAVIILVFKDTILSFVASIQIASYDLVKVGDWIEVPKYGVDGDIMDISLHTIKVRNFDKTITVIPTLALIETSFKNWRGMVETGGRRIKRALYIDANSVKFCDDKMIERFKKIHVLKNYIESKKVEIEEYNKRMELDTSEIVNGRRMTNIGTFRAYIKEYLRNREDVHKGLTFLIRQLQPGEYGIPIEIYVFATTTAWVQYEEIQADIFDHIFAVVQQFELNVFQNPTGKDFRELNKDKK